MKKVLVAVILLVAASWVQADNRPDHFKGLPADTLQEAVANFSEYNKKLEAMLDKGFSRRDLGEVHRLTYTLENALEKIHEEVTQLVDTLEDLHLASEGADPETVRQKAVIYLEPAQTLIK
ncbi:hypothetical protein SAMN05660443_1174 [Marinospirillum celere]|uniref:Cytochrome b562 n=1 Tax=Marinospirillum celere TaxID=1122252 RepID=A0A1I1FSY5_9GAMM|nr:DUF6746 family protein [Marinospirillum celere]SFC02116.1 hypothetical protein SAMN05660443_1174 [Marinospirillum celere]